MAKRGPKKGSKMTCAACGKTGHNRRSHKKSADKPRTKEGLRRKLSTMNVGYKAGTHKRGRGRRSHQQGKMAGSNRGGPAEGWRHTTSAGYNATHRPKRGRGRPRKHASNPSKSKSNLGTWLGLW